MELEKALEQYFGFSAFRGNQREIVSAIVEGRDVLTLMSTGGGKSLCFQLPAVLLPGLTVVVSPLISLMEDQVDHLVKQNISATWITHQLPKEELQKRLHAIRNNEYKLIYVSPERLQNDRFGELLQSVSISLVVIDEAHCISEWGHEFRPEYRQISTFLAKFPTRPIVAAFTATATLTVAKDIVDQLSLKKPAIFHTSVVRTNLSLNVVSCIKQHEKWLHLIRVLKKHANTSGIIYGSTREGTEILARRLSALAAHHPAFSWLHVGYYHAGLEDIERRTTQQSFQSGKLNLLCATTAFGMGIDKGDIRFVIHAQHPNCLESYFQQVGRAGRDGAHSHAYAFFHDSDAGTHLQMIEKQQDKMARKRNEKRLKQMVSFCQKDSCRMQQISHYFGEVTDPCGDCDVCLGLYKRHPYLQSPLSEKELGILHSDKLKRVVSTQRITDFQLVTAVCLEPASIADWQFVPGCAKGWRNEYARLNPTRTDSRVSKDSPAY